MVVFETFQFTFNNHTSLPTRMREWKDH